MTIEQMAIHLAGEVGVDVEYITWDGDTAVIEESDEPGWELDDWSLTIKSGTFRATLDLVGDDVRLTARPLLASLRAVNEGGDHE